ncbi:flagellar hook-length control protein FliK [Fontibacillus phaseoli]|uniref:Flagellar hook-length control protein FliK n=1 Tax=Fontibacillus phaseoli TaxID=1416533 RepID=A0A369BL37_9BACL|nr:flagellar hook-length control protein FliK [Fontibacillus phaseoli]RCX21306.1 flagellar hook-length control protein FliK [Fontibacillus phaseoli]
MSQTLSNVSTGSAVGGLWYGSGGKNVSGEGSGVSFDQTLISMLTGGVKPQEGQLAAQMALLAGLTENGEGVNPEGNVSGLDAMLQGLLQQLDQLDEALTENPELLAVLQTWLLNVHMFLQNNATGQSIDSGATESLLPALAEHPQTVRFAVQDALLQLAASSKSNASVVSGTETLQAKALMGSLQSLMSAAGLNGDAKPLTGKQVGQATNLQASKPNDNPLSLNQAGQAVAAKSEEGQFQVSVIAKTDISAVKVSPVTVSPVILTGEDSGNTGSESSDSDHPLQAGNIVTAGQLVLRDSAATALKSATPQVPVEDFGQEMSRFLVSKLDIVKAGGVSEARISLYPEHLGQVDVKITMQNGHMVAQFMTEHTFAKESLEAQLAQLRSALQSQGLQVGKLEVTQNTALSSHMYQDGRQQGNGTNQQQNGKRREVVREEELLAINDLNDEWNEWISGVRERESSLGSSFVARA